MKRVPITRLLILLVFTTPAFGVADTVGTEEKHVYVVSAQNYNGPLYRLRMALDAKLEPVGHFPPLQYSRSSIAFRPGHDEVYEFKGNRIGVLNLNSGRTREVVVDAVKYFGRATVFSEEGDYLYTNAIEPDGKGYVGVVIDPEKGTVLKRIHEMRNFFDTACFLVGEQSLLYGSRRGLVNVPITGDRGESVISYFTTTSNFIPLDISIRGGTVYVLAHGQKENAGYTELLRRTEGELEFLGKMRGEPFGNNGVKGDWYSFEWETDTVNCLGDVKPSYRASLMEQLGKERFKKYRGDENTGYKYVLDDQYVYLDDIHFTGAHLAPSGDFSVFVHDGGERRPSFVVLRDNKNGKWGRIQCLSKIGPGMTNIVFD